MYIIVIHHQISDLDYVCIKVVVYAWSSNLQFYDENITVNSKSSFLKTAPFVGMIEHENIEHFLYA